MFHLLPGQNAKSLPCQFLLPFKDNNGSPFRILAMTLRLAHDHVRHLHALQAPKELLSWLDHHNQDRTVHPHVSNALPGKKRCNERTGNHR